MAKFQPGQSGNPGGRPKQYGDVREIARQHTEAAIATLLTILGDSAAPHGSRVSAACAILDRGWGKPEQPVKHEGDEFWSGFAERMAEARKRAEDRAWLDDPPNVN